MVSLYNPYKKFRSKQWLVYLLDYFNLIKPERADLSDSLDKSLLLYMLYSSDSVLFIILFNFSFKRFNSFTL